MVVAQQAAEALTALDRAALPIGLRAGFQQTVPHGLPPRTSPLIMRGPRAWAEDGERGEWVE